MPLRSSAFWFARAEEARTAADDMRSVAGRQTMLSIADQYEALARASDRFEGKYGKPREGWSDEMP